MSIGDFVVVILGSSVGVALINWAASARTSRKQREATALLQTQKEQHEATLQTQTENHAAKLRRDQAHDDARDTFLPTAEALALYFTKEAYDLHYDQVGIFTFPRTDRDILTDKPAVMDAARAIMWGHPTAAVRDQAQTIYDSLVNYWYDTERDSGPRLNQDEANGLERAAAHLIQLIHAESPASPTA